MAVSQSTIYSGPSGNYTAYLNEQGQVVQGAPADSDLPTRDEWIQAQAERIRRSSALAMSAERALAFATRMADRPENASKFQGQQSTYVPLGAQGSQVGQQAAQQALDLLRPYATSANGLTSADNAAMGAANNSAALQSQAMIQSLAQQAAMRGVGNAGLTQTMQAQAAQQGANNAAQMGSNILGMAQNRKMQAIGALGQAGMGLDTQAMQRGSIVDQFNQNATNSQGQAALAAYGTRVNDQQLEGQKWDRLTGAATSALGMFGMGGGGR